MKKLIYISFIFAFILAFASCEKEVITPNDLDSNSQYRIGDDGVAKDSPGEFYRGGEGGEGGDDPSVTDPDEDEDFEDEGVTDPDEDDDFEDEGKGGKGKGK